MQFLAMQVLKATNLEAPTALTPPAVAVAPPPTPVPVVNVNTDLGASPASTITMWLSTAAAPAPPAIDSTGSTNNLDNSNLASTNLVLLQ